MHFLSFSPFWAAAVSSWDAKAVGLACVSSTGAPRGAEFRQPLLFAGSLVTPGLSRSTWRVLGAG